jgi:hypothetical protein
MEWDHYELSKIHITVTEDSVKLLILRRNTERDKTPIRRIYSFAGQQYTVRGVSFVAHCSSPRTYCIKDEYCQTFNTDVCFERNNITYTSLCGYINPWLGELEEKCALTVDIRIDRRYRILLEIELSTLKPCDFWSRNRRECVTEYIGPDRSVVKSYACLAQFSCITIDKLSTGTQLVLALHSEYYRGSVYSDWFAMLLRLSRGPMKRAIILYANYRSLELNTNLINGEWVDQLITTMPTPVMKRFTGRDDAVTRDRYLNCQQ